MSDLLFQDNKFLQFLTADFSLFFYPLHVPPENNTNNISLANFYCLIF